MNSMVYPLLPDQQRGRVERRSRQAMLTGILTFLRLSPRQEMWLVRKIEENARSMLFDDAIYIALREMEYSDRMARLAILTGRRTDAPDGRRDRALQETRQRLQGLWPRQA